MKIETGCLCSVFKKSAFLPLKYANVSNDFLECHDIERTHKN